MQTWPELAKPPATMRSTARSRLAFSSMMVAELLPSSSVIIFMPASLAICRPTGGLPVKVTMLTRSSMTSLLPSVLPGPTTTCRTLSGSPASVRSSASRSAVTGVDDAGLSTTTLPDAIAGATLWATRLSGKLKGEIATITPRGSRSVQPMRFSPPDSALISMTSPAVRLASSLAQRKVFWARLISTRGVLERLAALGRDDARHLLGVLLDEVRGPLEDLGALPGRCPAERLEGDARPVEDLVRLLQRGRGEGGHLAAVPRAAYGHRLAAADRPSHDEVRRHPLGRRGPFLA